MDDSHGTGVMGATGRGIHEHFDLMGEIDILTGTLGKALGGAAGGYVAASAAVCDILSQRSRPQLFSNALPPTVACSALRAVERLRENPEMVDRLRSNTALLQAADRGRRLQPAARRRRDRADRRRRDGAFAIRPVCTRCSTRACS